MSIELALVRDVTLFYLQGFLTKMFKSRTSLELIFLLR
jgi:hypothetical protein